jgi:hypothetical protein
MQPHPGEVIGAVAKFLRDVVVPKAEPLVAFQTNLAINALEMMRRQLELASAAEAEELERLTAMLGHAGTLAELNAEFAGKVGSGELDLSMPGIADHLWATTLRKSCGIFVRPFYYRQPRRALKDQSPPDFLI